MIFFGITNPIKSVGIIVQKYEEGGLNIIALDSFINALKATWVKRLTNRETNGQWKHIYLNHIKRFGGTHIFESNFNDKDAKQLVKNKF